IVCGNARRSCTVSFTGVTHCLWFFSNGLIPCLIVMPLETEADQASVIALTRSAVNAIASILVVDLIYWQLYRFQRLLIFLRELLLHRPSQPLLPTYLFPDLCSVQRSVRSA